MHNLTRPDGTTHTFFKKDGEWITTTRTPLSLKQDGDNWVVTTPADSQETYNNQGQLTQVTNTQGQSIHLSYNTKAQLSKVTGHFGRTLELTYNAQNQLTKATGSDGTVTYQYNADGQLESVTKIDGTQNHYQYTDGKLTAIIDATGNTVASYQYDEQGRITQSTAANNTRARSISYNADAVTVTDVATDASDTYHFDISHGMMKLAGITDTDGNAETRLYDANGYPAKITAKNGTITQTVYDYRGLLVSRTTSAGTTQAKTTLTDWHPNFRKPVKQVEPGKVTFSEYDTTGLLLKRIEGVVKPGNKKLVGKSKQQIVALKKISKDTLLKSGDFDIRETRYEYTENGQSKGTTAPNGATNENSYDNQGNRSASKNALGHESKTLAFDPVGRALKAQDANGIITESQYDVAGRLMSTTSNGQTTTYEYDNVGRQTKVTYPDGSTTQNEYDAAGNQIKTIDQDGNITENSYDSNGNQTANKIMDKDGNVLLSSQSVYNKNQLIKSIDAEGNETSYEYDKNGNQIKTIDANGNETQNEYDGENRLVKMTDPLGGETKYTYDINGNLTQVIAPNGATTTFVYDNFNQLISEASPDRGTTTYAYDVSGNQTSITDANGNIHRLTYDILNRKTGESWDSAPDLTVAYEYDTCRIGNLCKTTDKSGSTALNYDSEGKVIQKDSNIEGTTLSLKYSYDENDKLKSATYPSGKVISYSYDVDKISAIAIDGNPLITDISYNAANQLTGWKWADGTQYARTYDDNGRLNTFPLGNNTRTLDYNKLGNITGWQDSNSDEYKSFQYDALSRLTSYNKNKAVPNADDQTLQSQLFNYDANGNRLNLNETDNNSQNSVQTVYNILENSNRLTQVGDTPYQYDANGNVINDGERTYHYDARNRLVQVDTNNSYLYNANNMRVKKTTQKGTTLYGWDNDRIFAEYDGSGNAVQETVYFGSTPIALLKGGKTYRIYADQIDTPRVITEKQTNQTLWAWNSKPFGESQPNEDVDGDQVALNYNLRFPGQYYDRETGKHYNFNRDYNPVTGRYVQSDPIGVDGNGYFYTTAPLLSFDSSGLYTINDAKGRLSSMRAPKRKRTRNGRGRYFYSYADWQIFDQWLRLERNDRGWISKLPKCPRRISVSWWGVSNPNPRIWENPRGLVVWYFHPGASYEMRSKPVSGNHANQCTYDKNGRVISRIPAAGSADRVSKSSSFWGHKYHDVDTFSLAEGLNRVRDYYSVRPVIIE